MWKNEYITFNGDLPLKNIHDMNWPSGAYYVTEVTGAWYAYSDGSRFYHSWHDEYKNLIWEDTNCHE